MTDPVTGLPLASFWRRLGGLAVDGFLVLVLFPPAFFALDLLASVATFFIAVAFYGLRMDLPTETAVHLLMGKSRWLLDASWKLELVATPLLVSAAYWVWSVAAWGATPGMMAAGARVVRTDGGGRPDPGRAALRWAAGAASALPLGLGLLWAAWDPRKQGWHDKIAKTLVVLERRNSG